MLPFDFAQDPELVEGNSGLTHRALDFGIYGFTQDAKTSRRLEADNHSAAVLQAASQCDKAGGSKILKLGFRIQILESQLLIRFTL